MTSFIQIPETHPRKGIEFHVLFIEIAFLVFQTASAGAGLISYDLCGVYGLHWG